jgi:putative ABC transport system permease protein
MDGLLQDLRYVLRTLKKSPAFVTISVLTLALGIGANLAIFTIVNAVLLQPLPFREPDRIVRVFDDLGGAGAKNVGMSVPELYDLQRSGVFEQISVIFPASQALSGGDGVDRLMSSLLFGVSASDPMTFAVVPVLLGIVTMAACFIPARLATRVSPMEVLK